jgi:hypothetical protein
MNPPHGIVVGAIHRIKLNHLIVKCWTLWVVLAGIWQKISIFVRSEFRITKISGIIA